MNKLQLLILIGISCVVVQNVLLMQQLSSNSEAFSAVQQELAVLKRDLHHQGEKEKPRAKAQSIGGLSEDHPIIQGIEAMKLPVEVEKSQHAEMFQKFHSDHH